MAEKTEVDPRDLIQQELDKRLKADDASALIQEELGRRGVADTSPIPVPPSGQELQEKVRKGFGVELPGQLGEAQKADVVELDELIIKAADAGVVYDSPARSGHFLASLAYDDENRVTAFTRSLKESYGQDIEVRVGPDTGALEYFDPDTGRYALVNPPGTSLEDIEGFGGPAIVLSSESMGGILGGVLGSNPMTVALGAGGGAFLGEITRLKLGQRMGINENVTDTDIVESAITEAGITVGLGVAGEKLLTFGKFLINVIDGRPFNRKTLDALDIEMEEAFELQRQINEKIGSTEFRFNLAQATLDEDILVLTDTLRRSREYAKEFGLFEKQQKQALTDFYDTINKPYQSRLTTEQTGKRAQDVAGGRVETELRRADLFVEMKQKDLDVALGNLKTNPHEDLGRILRGFADEEYAAFNQWASDAAGALHRAAGEKAFIPNRRLHNVVSRMSDEMRDAIFPRTKAGTKGLLGSEFETVEGQKILRALFDPDAEFTFKQAWDAVSELKRIERTAAMGLSTEEPSVAAVRQLYGALERDMRDAMQASPLREQYDAFVRKYAAEKARLDHGVIGQIMTKEGRNGRFVVADNNVFLRVFSGKREAEELHALIENSPEMMQGVRESIGDFYKRTVLEDGRVNLSRHKAFLERFGKAASVFFNKNEMKLLSTPGNVEKALRAREVSRAAAVKEINSSFDAQIANLNNPGKLISMIMDPKNPDKARQLMEILEKAPDVQRAVKNEFRKVMEERTAGQFKNGERFFSPSRFDEFLNGKGGEGGFKSVARNIFGDQYVADLDLLNQVFKRVSAEPRFPNRSNTAFWIDTVKNLSRAYVGLFTRPGRMLTALDRIRARSANRVFVRVINDPQKLRELMELRGQDMRSKKARAFISSVGGSALLQDYE